jgi:hypothetical protein
LKLRWVSWRRRLANRPGGQPAWLLLRSTSSWGLGCSFCEAAGHLGPLATFSVRRPTLGNLYRHQRTPAHQQAVRTGPQTVLAVSGGVPATPPAVAPPATDFSRVWDNMATKHSHGKGVEGVGTWRKTRKMEWRLASACRRQHREFLRHARVVSLMQDARQQNLLIRVVAVDQHLQTRHFVLGVQRDYGSGALGVKDATLKILEDACRVDHRPPGMGAGSPDGPGGPDGNLDVALYKHLCNSIEVFTADAALDEQIAGRKLRNPSLSATPDLPNLRLVLRDKAHASRRRLVAQRTARKLHHHALVRLAFLFHILPGSRHDRGGRTRTSARLQRSLSGRDIPSLT